MFDSSPLQASFAELRVAVDSARYCSESDIDGKLAVVHRHLRALCLLPHLLETRMLWKFGLRNSDEVPDDTIVQAAYEIVHRLHETFHEVFLPFIDYDRLPQLAEFLETLDLETSMGGMP